MEYSLEKSIKGRVLIIAGSDSGGGAGIQADIKTVTVLGGYAATAITALTAQNTLGVSGIFPVSPAFVSEQIEAVLSDIGADSIKTGMLYSEEIIHVIADCLTRQHPVIKLVLDPVMVAKGGAPLLQPSAIGALKTRLVPLATVFTPNIPEAELLCGYSITSVEEMEKAAVELLSLGCKAVLLKGGHLPDSLQITDILAEKGTIMRYNSERIATNHTHGTGCSLASAIACGLAQGMKLPDSVTQARDFILQAIASAPGIGKGHGPLNHGWMLA